MVGSQRFATQALQAFVLATSLLACSREAAENASNSMSRGPKLIYQPEVVDSLSFDRNQSAGLFVGVDSFSHGLCDGCGLPEKKILELKYAVDDAIDLAYRFSIQLGLIPPQQVRLLLSGQPWKEVSRLRLDELARSGAKVTWQANKTDILSCLVHLARHHSGSSGLLVVSIASHGVTVRSDDFILGSDTIHGFLSETGVRTATLLDITSWAPSARRLILIDACRENIVEDGHGVGPDPQTAASARLASAIGQSEGEAVFLAARTGAWSYDDDERRNGAFTRAFLDSLQCDPCSKRDRMITVSTLADEVDQRVAVWTKMHRPSLPREKHGITFRAEGSIKAMPLLLCPPAQVPDPCHRLTLAAIELLDKEGIFRRFPLNHGRITIPGGNFEAVGELVGRPVFRDAPNPPGCPWRWEELRALGEWEEIESRPGGAFSIDKPSPGRVAALRLLLCGTEPREVNLLVQ
jgi:Caspase domain